MALGIMVGMFTGVGGHVMPDMALENLHPQAETMPIWPLMFVTVACGAIILQAGEGIHLSTSVSYPAGVVFAVVFLLLYLKSTFWGSAKAV